MLERILEDVYRLPIRDGNLSQCVTYVTRFFVYRLPIRDGNMLRHPSINPHVSVYRLPIRDGNPPYHDYHKIRTPFIDYL